MADTGRTTGGGKGVRKKRVVAKTKARPTGRPDRLAHLVPGSERHQRRERAVQALSEQPLQPALLRVPAEGATPISTGQVGLSSHILCLPSPEWLPHRLTVTGPAMELADFRMAACGPGTIPWHVDYDRLEEDWVNGMLTPPPAERGISLEGARILARQLRERLELQDSHAAEAAFGSTRCPLDLHLLVPIPDRLLQRGQDDPAVVAWLWENWGTTWALRGVDEIACEPKIALPADHTAIAYCFWSADWTPWRALASIRARWSSINFHISVRASE